MSGLGGLRATCLTVLRLLRQDHIALAVWQGHARAVGSPEGDYPRPLSSTGRAQLMTDSGLAVGRPLSLRVAGDEDEDGGD